MIREDIICGYTAPQNSRQNFGAIIIGMFSGKTLKYIEKCDPGFIKTSLKELHALFENLKILSSPFSKIRKIKDTKGKLYWIKPELVCNIKFLEWTQD